MSFQNFNNNKSGYVYSITNSINGKMYVGSTCNLRSRFLRHMNELRRNTHHNLFLQRDFNEYGESSFLFEPIVISDDFRNIENNFIAANASSSILYNIAIGNDTFSCNPNKEDIKIKLTETLNLNRDKIKPRYGEENSNWKGGSSFKFCKCGVTIQPQNKTCISCRDRSGKNNPFFNRKHSDETKAKLRDKVIGTYNGNQERSVSCEGISYRSVSSAAKALNVSPSLICYRMRKDKYKDYFYI